MYILFGDNSRKIAAAGMGTNSIKSIVHFAGGGICIDIWGRVWKLWSVERINGLF